MRRVLRRRARRGRPAAVPTRGDLAAIRPPSARCWPTCRGWRRPRACPTRASSWSRWPPSAWTTCGTPSPPPIRSRSLALEWLDPVFIGGHWVPQMIEMAGGIDVLGLAGEKSRTAEWAEVEAAAPEVIVSMPCGYGTERAAAETLQHADRLAALGARVAAVDASAYFSRPGPRLVDGIELMAHLLHPGLVPEPPAGAVRLAGPGPLRLAGVGRPWRAPSCCCTRRRACTAPTCSCWRSCAGWTPSAGGRCACCPSDGALAPLLEQAGAEVVVHPLAVLRRSLATAAGRRPDAPGDRGRPAGAGRAGPRARCRCGARQHVGDPGRGRGGPRSGGRARGPRARDLDRGRARRARAVAPDAPPAAARRRPGGHLAGRVRPVPARRRRAAARRAPAQPEPVDRAARPGPSSACPPTGSWWRSWAACTRGRARTCWPARWPSPRWREIGAVGVVAGDAIPGGDAGERLDALAADLGVQDRLRAAGLPRRRRHRPGGGRRRGGALDPPRAAGAGGAGGRRGRAPVVASADGGVAEVVRDGVSGLLVAPGDPAALAARPGAPGRRPARRPRAWAARARGSWPPSTPPGA